MKLIVSGPREELVKELRELADTIKRDGAAESTWGMNSLRTPDMELEIVWSEFEESSDDRVLYNLIELHHLERMAVA